MFLNRTSSSYPGLILLQLFYNRPMWSCPSGFLPFAEPPKDGFHIFLVNFHNPYFGG